MDFVDWMQSDGLSAKSAGSYLGAIKGSLSSWARTNKLSTKNIMDIPDLSEFAALSEHLRQTPEFKERNVRGNGMYAAALSQYKKFLQAGGSAASAKLAEYGPHFPQLVKIESEFEDPFNPAGQDDARARVLREVVQRRGQRKFRKALLTAYDGRCAITNCPVAALLEAAHITPYMGPETNSMTNGLLLRADLHTLWDLGLIAVDPENHKVWVSPEINDKTYRNLSGIPLTLPLQLAQWPSIAALKQQWDLVHNKLNESGLQG